MSKRLKNLRILGLALLVPIAVANVPPPSMAPLRSGADGQGIAVSLRKDEALPVPAVVAKIYRGQVDISNETNLDDGVLWLRVTIPDNSVLVRSEVGYLFQLVSGDLPRGLQNQIPTPYAVRSLQMSEDAFNFTFYWQDGAPGQHEPMDFILDVSVVTTDGRVGPSRRVRIK